MVSKPLVLTPIQQAEAVGNLLAVRQLAVELRATFFRPGETAAVKGADRMVAAIDRVLELLHAPDLTESPKA